jgi:hypothetical protein
MSIKDLHKIQARPFASVSGPDWAFLMLCHQLDMARGPEWQYIAPIQSCIAKEHHNDKF